MFGYVPSRVPDIWWDKQAQIDSDTGAYIDPGGILTRVDVTAPFWKPLLPWVLGACLLYVFLSDDT
jgi:hypothetical protein